VRRTIRRPAALLATLTATILAAGALAATPALAAGTEHITNGTFTSGTAPWWGTTNLSIAASSGQLCTQVPSGTENAWDAIVGYSGVPLVKGDKYTVTFDASASVATTVKANAQMSEDPYTATMSRDTALSSSMRSFTYTFTSSLDDPAGSIQFQIGGASRAWRFCLDNVSVVSEAGTVDPNGPENVVNGAFDEGMSSWYTYGTDDASVTGGALCAEVPAGLANPWDAGIGQNGIELVEGATYTFAFEASADPDMSIRASVQLGEEPYTAYLAQTVSLESDQTAFSYAFTADESTTLAQVAFQIGGSASAATVCLDNVSLRGGPEAE